MGLSANEDRWPSELVGTSYLCDLSLLLIPASISRRVQKSVGQGKGKSAAAHTPRGCKAPGSSREQAARPSPAFCWAACSRRAKSGARGEGNASGTQAAAREDRHPVRLGTAARARSKQQLLSSAALSPPCFLSVVTGQTFQHTIA